jgi:hypothetical protein
VGAGLDVAKTEHDGQYDTGGLMECPQRRIALGAADRRAPPASGRATEGAIAPESAAASVGGDSGIWPSPARRQWAVTARCPRRLASRRSGPPAPSSTSPPTSAKVFCRKRRKWMPPRSGSSSVQRARPYNKVAVNPTRPSRLATSNRKRSGPDRTYRPVAGRAIWRICLTAGCRGPVLSAGLAN